MSLNCTRSVILLVVFFVTIGSFTLAPSFSLAQDNAKIIVLYDESHGQAFNSVLLGEALSAISQFAAVRSHRSGEINGSVLGDVDVLIISNPAPNATFSATERTEISSWLSKGKGLFLLGNPYSINRTIAGSPVPLNTLLHSPSDLAGSRTGFWSYLNDTDVVMDRLASVPGDWSVLQVTVNTSSHELFQYASTPLIDLRFQSSTVNTSVPIVEAYKSAYAEGPEPSNVRFLDSRPPVLGVESVGSSGRLLVCGSSLMFSEIVDPVNDDSWFSSVDNAVLWECAIRWLGKTQIEEPTVPPTYLDLTAMILSLAVAAAFVIGTGLVVHLGWGYWLAPRFSLKEEQIGPTAAPLGVTAQRERAPRRGLAAEILQGITGARKELKLPRISSTSSKPAAEVSHKGRRERRSERRGRRKR